MKRRRDKISTINKKQNKRNEIEGNYSHAFYHRHHRHLPNIKDNSRQRKILRFTINQPSHKNVEIRSIRETYSRPFLCPDLFIHLKKFCLTEQQRTTRE